MTTRARSAAVAMVAIALSSLLGCAPEPAPVPTPTPAFASEEEAFAAAEEVYRAYNDALNERRAGDPDADPQRFLTGGALEVDIDTQNTLVSNGLSAVGTATIDSLMLESSEFYSNAVTIRLTVCTDVSALSLLDRAGANVTPAERGNTVALAVVLIGNGESLLISDALPMDDDPC
ncbi:hypothetical protein HWD99_12595 [Microbacterium sp. C5A9]|uniref:hypothetical protein n=1 Tax=Microbacterium sp. C5A9 TaxID=2736663 RepID=UPI001F527D26|nr:hypothetical protein [Microbacterium sp. C5A9]MCI1019466.1 hypothetical protein [Microbacterium sp. C5A9]